MTSDIFAKFIENAAFIAAAASALFLVIDAVLLRSKPWRERRWRTIGLMAIVVLTVGTSLGVVAQRWTPLEGWALWRAQISQTFEQCRTDARAILEQELITLESERYSKDWQKENHLDYQCLTLALAEHRLSMPAGDLRSHGEFSRNPGPGEAYGPLRDYLKFQLAGSQLYQIDNVANLLKEKFGIYSNLFLGTGFSYPHSNLSNATGGVQYRAGVREYLVPNYCVGQPEEECVYSRRPASRLWVWILDREYIDQKSGESLKSILDLDPENFGDGSPKAFPAQPGAANGATLNKTSPAYDQQMKKYIYQIVRGPERTADQALIRISQFPPEYYRNTVGRPERDWVFFANLEDMYDRSLLDARILTGRIVENTTNADERVFIWLLLTDPSANDSGNIASWSFVFRLMDQGASQAIPQLRRLVEGRRDMNLIQWVRWNVAPEAQRADIVRALAETGAPPPIF